MNTPSTGENPFEFMKTIIINDADNLFVEFCEQFTLSHLEAKVIWVSCPEFQEKFCRERITGSKKCGGSEHGNKNWLRRRFKLSENELEVIFRDIWSNPKEKISNQFLTILNAQRIAESQLTQEAQAELKVLQVKYGNEFYRDRNHNA